MCVCVYICIQWLTTHQKISSSLLAGILPMLRICMYVLHFWEGVVYKRKVDFFLKYLNRILFLNLKGNDNRLRFFSLSCFMLWNDLLY